MTSNKRCPIVNIQTLQPRKQIAAFAKVTNKDIKFASAYEKRFNGVFDCH